MLLEIARAQDMLEKPNLDMARTEFLRGQIDALRGFAKLASPPATVVVEPTRDPGVGGY